jgi:4-aminobutyrate aminotransferase-like enzyme
MREDNVLANVRARGEELLAGLRALRCPAIAEVRGMGLLLGVEFVHPDTLAPLPELASAVRAGCFARGLLVELGGRHHATMRLVPPLVITSEHVAEALSIVGAAIDAGWREVQAA